MTKIYDRYSVGVLIFQNDHLLMLERATPPLGVAPAAGRINDQASRRTPLVPRLSRASA
ncbi:hypothetical protein [Streptosporangium jomthongense]|uniref:NUDIX hydrolase n=1 Tax=Streptosporangium jomthongense TaxID=1193683 RepID=A0ABV8F297_9ACTN